MPADSFDPGGGWNNSYDNLDDSQRITSGLNTGGDSTQSYGAAPPPPPPPTATSAGAGAGGTMPKDPAAATASQQASYSANQQQTAVAADQQARSVYNDLSSAGHDVSWQGAQLMVDGRPYDVPGGQQTTSQQGITDPAVTQPGATPAGAADSASIGAGIPWNPGEDHPSYNPPGYQWDAKTASFQPLASQQQTSGGYQPYSGAPTDRAAIKAWIGTLASMPGADPSLANDPDYWVGRIVDTGGLRGDNSEYWMKAGVGSSAFFNNPNREAGGGVPAGAVGPSAAESYQAPTLGTTAMPTSPNLPTVVDPNANWNPSFTDKTYAPPPISDYKAPDAPWGAEGPTTYKGEKLDTSDIPNFTYESLLKEMRDDPSSTSLNKLVTSLTDSQGPLDQKTIDTIKGQQKDALAEQAQFQDQNLKGMGGAMGIGDSPWLAAQRAQGMFSRDQSIASTGAAIDVDAAKTNYAARQANAGIGTTYQNARTAQYMQAVDAGLQRATVTGNRQALQASIDQAAAASGQSAQKIMADWVQHNTDAATAKELAKAGIQLDYDKLNSANTSHLQDLMVAVQQLKTSSSLQTQTANLNATLQKYGIDVNAALQMSAQQLQKYGIDSNTQLQLTNLKQQHEEFFAGLGQADKQFGANYGLNFAKMQHDFSNDDWMHSYMDTANL